MVNNILKILIVTLILINGETFLEYVRSVRNDW